MKPWNVTRIAPPGDVHAAALAEATAYLHACLRALGEPAALSINRIDGAARNVVACAHLLDAGSAARLPADTIVFNSERLIAPTDWPLASPVYRHLLATHTVWDYSARNTAALGHPRAAVIPFGFRAELVRPPARAPGEAVVFHGVLTPRRRELLAALTARGVPVEVGFGEYGAARDHRVAGARAVLNLHKTDAALFEPIRCFDALTQGCPVLSEPTTDPSAAAFRDEVFWLEPTMLVDDLVALLADRSTWAERAAAQLAHFRARSPLPGIAAAVAAARAHG